MQCYSTNDSLTAQALPHPYNGHHPLLVTLAHGANPTTITGKVIGIANGDTITVLQDRTQYKIRLYGIDCPESHSPYQTQNPLQTIR